MKLNTLAIVFVAMVLGIAGCETKKEAGAPAGPVVPKGPTTIDVSKATGPVFDDPVWHAPTDPAVIWNPMKNEWTMYYTQRRGTMTPTNGVDWVHGTAIGIATSADGVEWKYEGICQGDDGLSDPVKEKVTWWAPTYVMDAGKMHMFVTWVDGIYTGWTGKRFIKHFVSEDGVNWKFVSRLTLSSERCIDAMVYKVGDEWYMVYKDEASGSHTWLATSKDLNEWKVVKELFRDVSQEGPWVMQWKGSWWLVVDPLRGQGGLRFYKGENGIDGWVYNASILGTGGGANGVGGKRPLDDTNGKHPALIVQGDKCIIYYFTEKNRKAVIQMAEVELGADGKVFCNRDKYAFKGGDYPILPAY